MRTNLVEEDVIDYSQYCLGELQEIIGIMEDEPVKDRRSKAYKAYVKELNELFDIYNTKSKTKTYIKIKV